MKKFTAVSVLIFVVLLTAWVTLFNLCFPLHYRNEIITAGKTYSINPTLIASIINAESSFDKNKISPKQAIGLMQLLPTTAQSLTDNENIDLFDPETNINLGVKYLSYLINKFNDIDTALFAYNAGEGNVTRWLNEQGTKRLTTCPFKETNAYVTKIKKSLKYYRGRI